MKEKLIHLPPGGLDLNALYWLEEEKTKDPLEDDPQYTEEQQEDQEPTDCNRGPNPQAQM